MEQVYQFDFVHDTQAVFRRLLSAVAHPLEAQSIAAQAAGFSWEHPELWAAACTLMDNETSFFVEMDAELGKGLADLTLSRQVSAREADYVFLSAQLNYDTIRVLFETAKKGTLADPQRSATFLISCQQFEGEAGLTAEGPGIKDAKMRFVTPYISRICQIRSEVKMEYPCGIDLFFISRQGSVMALPRLCRTWPLKLSEVKIEGTAETEKAAELLRRKE